MNTLRSMSIWSTLEHSALEVNGDTFPNISRCFQLGLHLHPIDSATCLIVALMLSLFCPIPPLFAQVSVLTQHNDNGRTGQNLNETVLKTSNVNVNQFGKLFSVSVDGQIYAQVLYVPQLTTSSGIHNVIYVATENDSVYAFDADNGGLLWHISLGTPVPSSDICCNYSNMVPSIGITATPVIDLGNSTIYVVAKTKDTTNNAYHQKLHALDITSGAEKFSGPVEITASVAGTGSGSSNGTVTFDPLYQGNRTGLLLLNGIVYLSFGSVGDDNTWHGWVLGYDESTLQRVGVFNVTPNGSSGGVWQGGQGLAADTTNIYFMTGNGTFDVNVGGSDYGDSVVKLGTSGGLAVLDFFTPDTQNTLDSSDLDLGSGGPMLLPGTHLIVGGGKDGILRLIDTSNMGHYNSTSNNDIQEFQATNGKIMGGPIYWNSPDNGPVIYLWAPGDYLKVFKLAKGSLQTSPVSQSAMTIPAGNSNASPMSLSSNGSQAGTGIIWATASYSGDADDQIVPGILRALDASDVSKELWDSKQNASRDDLGNYAKFCPPTISNGKVYLATFSNQLVVYGLLPTGSAPRVTSVSPNSGTRNGGTAVTITGSGFLAGATVTFGGSSATNVSVVSSTGITATTPPHSVGSVSVVVTNPNGQSATLLNGFIYKGKPR
jgi:outer membrane protein assembly factor BamB